ncbi:Lactoylglutathione lyase @ Cadmium-induced protein CadI [hydrothermal vent metagenome]|uniref:Lactoylglutathione lyase @ Cadmium-induced protein CadI n=1 Tax=hydrothermal vent metagenome TaxID=652676 RepID=A0A1W1CH82_9ZZZZ
MKRLHIHMSVDNIEESVKFYSTQFGAEPTKLKGDYAQWLLDELSLNFAISTRGEKKGLNHLGVQYDSDEALDEAQKLFEAKGIKGKEDKGAVCCYKESNKYWVNDPTGIVWENYHSMDDIEVFGLDEENASDGCCVPKTGMFSTTPSSGCC